MSDQPRIRLGVGSSDRVRRLLTQGLSFLAVGGIGFLVDVGVFNLLRATLLAPEHVAGGALWAKTISVGLAIVVNWIGNRAITFRRERRSGDRRAVAREGVEFLVASLLGSAISLICLAVSHYGLGLRSAAADNISANVVGLGLGTVLRFALYRLWVFRSPVTAAAPDAL